MDVEAQDDGILAKIVVPDGTHNVRIGKTIAVLAEEGDDISSIEVPAEESQSTSTAPSTAKAKGTKPKEQPAQTGSVDHKKALHFAATYPPAVLRLLQEYGIKDPKSIAATGPQGRLLKGDVLAYVGTINSDIPKILKDILAKKRSIDLSNITVQHSQAASQPQSSIPCPKKSKPPAHIDAVIQLTELSKIRRLLSGGSLLLR